jgi:hypothetical protein
MASRSKLTYQNDLGSFLAKTISQSSPYRSLFLQINIDFYEKNSKPDADHFWSFR